MDIERTIEIAVSPATLWPLLTESEQMKRWMPELVSSEPVTPGSPRVGSITHVVIKEGAREVEYTSEVIALDPQAHLEIELKGASLGASPMRVEYRLAAAGASTSLWCNARWQPRGLMLRLMSPLINVMGRRNNRLALQRLKALAES